MSRTKAAVATKAKATQPKARQAKPKARPAVAEPQPAPKETRSQEAHRIQELINTGTYTVPQLVEKTGLSLKRVQSHVDFEINVRNRAKLNPKKQVVLTGEAPRYRTAS